MRVALIFALASILITPAAFAKNHKYGRGAGSDIYYRDGGRSYRNIDRYRNFDRYDRRNLPPGIERKLRRDDWRDRRWRSRHWDDYQRRGIYGDRWDRRDRRWNGRQPDWFRGW